MRYCVRLGTANELESSEFNTDEIFLRNAIEAGFAESEVEIITEEEYLARKELEPVEPQELPLELRNRADIDYIAIMTGVDL